MEKLFVDSAAFIALADTADQYHQRAQKFSQTLRASARLYTSDVVVAETHSNLQYHLGSQAAMTFLQTIVSGDSGVDVLIPAREDLIAASRIAQKYQDQDFSFVDCFSFALMERHRIEHVFTFDRHFAIYRHDGKHFKILPG